MHLPAGLLCGHVDGLRTLRSADSGQTEATADAVTATGEAGGQRWLDREYVEFYDDNTELQVRRCDGNFEPT